MWCRQEFTFQALKSLDFCQGQSDGEERGIILREYVVIGPKVRIIVEASLWQGQGGSKEKANSR